MTKKQIKKAYFHSLAKYSDIAEKGYSRKRICMFCHLASHCGRCEFYKRMGNKNCEEIKLSKKMTLADFANFLYKHRPKTRKKYAAKIVEILKSAFPEFQEK